MKYLLVAFALLTGFFVKAQTKSPGNKHQFLQEKYQTLPFGSVKPAGWIKIQMQKDMAGFVGHLDELVPELINDPIYGKGRLSEHSKVKDLGNLKEGDAEGSDQYKWRNSETQSNWWDGYIRNVILLNDNDGIGKVQRHVEGILATQDKDGYLGIYDKELRYQFRSENGELWAKTTLLRGLLAWYEATLNPKLWISLVDAVDNVMRNYPAYKSDPFNVGQAVSGGVAHGLTFTDVCEKMYQITGKKKYREYALFLYLNYSSNFSSETDAQLSNILKRNYKLKMHGVHTYEHLRPLTVAAYASDDKKLQKALKIYSKLIAACTTPAGGPIGDEWIRGRTADATHTGYEYCSIQELLDSYTLLYQKTGDSLIAGQIENIFYNAAQGARNPDHSGIAYLKTDNSFEMLGTRNGEVEPDRKQTRYKYSPAHQDVAVCCNPNAGRITPYFVQNMWLKQADSAFVASLLGPCVLRTFKGKYPLEIEEMTDYPYSGKVTFRIRYREGLSLKLKIRRPGWATGIETSEKYHMEEDYIVIERPFRFMEEVTFNFLAGVKVTDRGNGQHYFTYGPLDYALPIAAEERPGREYAPGFTDWFYAPKDSSRYEYVVPHEARFADGRISVLLKNKATGIMERKELLPLGKTILRQTAF